MADNEETEFEYSDSILWIRSRSCHNLGVSQDMFDQELLTSPDSQQLLSGWIDAPDQDVLYVYVVDSRLHVSVSHPAIQRGKAIFFMKLPEGAMSNMDVDDIDGFGNVIVGDVMPDTLQSLLHLSRAVYTPMVTNFRDQAGWPELTRRDILDAMSRFISGLIVTIGNTRGQTLLPVPVEVDGLGCMERNDSAAEKSRIQSVEQAVATWNRQVKGVVSLAPEDAMADGNPGPHVELAFWRHRAKDLKSILEQFKSPTLRKAIAILEESKSSYLSVLKQLQEEVARESEESASNVTFLAALEPSLGAMHEDSQIPFTEVPASYEPLLVTLWLVARNSPYYHTSHRLSVFLRQCCNAVVTRACKFVDSENVFQSVDDMELGVSRLQVASDVCVEFVDTFKNVHEAMRSCRPSLDQSRPADLWDFAMSTVFFRLNNFVARASDLLDMLHTMLEFSRLEVMEIGGTKGKTLTASIRQMYFEFWSFCERFQSLPYSILDTSAKAFEDDFYEFRTRTKEVERRLGAVLVQSFDDCTSVEAKFKLLETFDTLLQRSVISQEMARKNIALLDAVLADIQLVDEFFTNSHHDPPLSNNLPPVLGAVMWARSLLERIDQPIQRCSKFSSSLLQVDEGKRAIAQYDSLRERLLEYERKTLKRWAAEVESISSSKLKQPILRRDTTTGIVSVNFDRALKALLREVKYCLILKLQPPQSAAEIFQSAEIYRQQTGHLEIIVQTYNSIMMGILEVEKPLLQHQLHLLEKILDKGCRSLNWKSQAVTKFIKDADKAAKLAKSMLSVLKDGVSRMNEFFAEWSETPLIFTRKPRTYELHDLERNVETAKAPRLCDVRDKGEDIHRIMLEKSKSLKVSRGAPIWLKYVEYVNTLLFNGLKTAVLSSLTYIRDQVDVFRSGADAEIVPLLEVKLELVATSIVFNPPLGVSSEREGAAGGIGGRVLAWTHETKQVADLVKRLDSADESYFAQMEEDKDVSTVSAAVEHLVKVTQEKCEEFRQVFYQYDYLWEEDLQTSFATFLESEKDPVTGQVPLRKFDEKIQYYRSLQDVVGRLPNQQTVSWIRIDAKPVKQALGTCATKWGFAFSSHLQQMMETQLDGFWKFVTRVTDVLSKEGWKSGDMPAVREVLGCIRDVRVRMDEIDRTFAPLSNIVTILRKYDMTLSTDLLKQLDAAPGEWTTVKKKTWAAKEQVNPVQNALQEQIKARVTEFRGRLAKFRTHFLQNAPFDYSSESILAYDSIDRLYEGVKGLRAEAELISKDELLFELNVSHFAELDSCVADLLWMKRAWDIASMISFQMSAWRRIPWEAIFTDDLSEVAKALLKSIRSLPKVALESGLVVRLDKTVKRFLSGLPLIQDLRTPAMRDRHWSQLMRITGVQFQISADFSMGDLLNLQLHDHAESVGQIVEQARKEQSIEGLLRKVESVWESLAFEFEPHEGTNILRPPQAIIDILDDNLVQLQNLLAGRFVAFFEDIVRTWQQRLSAVEQTVSLWIDVQRRWTSLQSIFTYSEDIQKQLPEDTARFNEADSQWRILMRDATSKPKVLPCCEVEGRFSVLEKVMGLLELCEKSLAVYLERTRQQFPRFYFVSPADLVDILSKGGRPKLLVKHFPNCFLNIGGLKFATHPGMTLSGERAKETATAMVSSEGEEVILKEGFHFSGPVEVYMGRFLTAMRSTLQLLISEAVGVAQAVESRLEWILGYPAQVVVTTTRVLFTAEVEDAIQQMIDHGLASALKTYHQKQKDQLDHLANVVLGDLSQETRTKIITLITVDVHHRDVVANMLKHEVENLSHFTWQSQLRYYLDDAQQCSVQICDAEFKYGYEYIGNCGCLVMTPLTDRCYVTLTQALQLGLGASPSGPAGTGKTETTKDLARALGNMIYVFNCSDQMDYRSLGQIFKGLAQTGAWGCFDEFNRIPIEVLSVCSTQVKAILNAIRGKQDDFAFEGEERFTLVRSCGIFVTMNPGYAGRAELPESLKVQFRPVAMVVPDLWQICEIMLYAEGFVNAKTLSRKFVMLYEMCSDMLSKQQHYDWKLRAIKSVLVIAGTLKREHPGQTEDEVLMRAIRDFNLPKVVALDVPVLIGLVNGFFPGMTVSRVRNQSLEADIESAMAEMGLHKGALKPIPGVPVPAVSRDVAQTANKLQDGVGVYVAGNITEAPKPLPDASQMSSFVLKVLQLHEVLQLRWSVFIVGDAGTGKSEMWKTLLAAYRLHKRAHCYAINPKSVSTDELFGHLHPQTREWMEGLFSRIFRVLASTEGDAPKWIVLDGDIDPEWIESLNTVMDDNKVLTLASNERISLTPSMRLLFEVSHLAHATPATVSRAGVIYVNTADVSWEQCVDSWLDRKWPADSRFFVRGLFSKYITDGLEHVLGELKHAVLVTAQTLVSNLCRLLEGVLTAFARTHPADEDSIPVPAQGLLERVFDVCAVWSFGAALAQDKTADVRIAFSQFWRRTFKAVQYPEDGTVFDYFLEPETGKLFPWSARVGDTNFLAGVLSAKKDPQDDDFADFDMEDGKHKVRYNTLETITDGSVFVHTTDSTRLGFFVSLLLKHRFPVMLVGPIGCGKTLLVRERLMSLDESSVTVAQSAFTAFTTSVELQTTVEMHIEKKAGRQYGPIGSKRLVLFLDDFNLPLPDKYGTQTAASLLRQHLAYGTWYDRTTTVPMDIGNTQYITCMNPAARADKVDSRVLRWFSTFAYLPPSEMALFTIFYPILTSRYSELFPDVLDGVDTIDEKIEAAFDKENMFGLTSGMAGVWALLVRATQSLHVEVCEQFPTSASRFVYQFNMRDIASVITGLCRIDADNYRDAPSLIHLWQHECQRVYGDRMVTSEEQATVVDMVMDHSRKFFEDVEGKVEYVPHKCFASFVDAYKHGIDLTDAESTARYLPADPDELRRVVEEQLSDYNLTHSIMDLVLFEQALHHVVRIARVLSQPGGNMLLVGVGGSGKQSLARLASHLCGMPVRQFSVTETYSEKDLKADLQELYMRAGLKGVALTLLLTDTQIVDNKFLVYIGETMATANLPQLFSADEMDAIHSSMRLEVKQAGDIDTKEKCWSFFTRKVVQNIHVVLCYSPVGDTFRQAVRTFPVLLSCMTIDWFHPWPLEALESVATRFLGSR
eukprot:Rmarinus@m.1646